MKNKWVRISLVVPLVIVISISALYFSRVNAVSVDIAEKNKEFRPGLTTEQKLEDFEYLYNILKDNFPYFDVEARKTGYYWPEHKSEFEDMIRNTEDDKEFYFTLNEILEKVHNGHTNLVSVEGYPYDYYIYKLLESMSNKLIYKPWNDVIQNSYSAYEKWGEILDKPLREYIPPDESKNKRYVPNASTYIMERDKIAYMKIESFGQEFVEVDSDRIKEFLISVKDYPYLIIDIRGNGGGSPSYWVNNILKYLLNKPIKYKSYVVFRDGDYIQPFIRAQVKAPKRPSSEINLGNTPPEVKKEGFGSYVMGEDKFKPVNPIGFKGKIFLLVDNKVYSSSESFAVFCKATGFATIVGTNTGGDGIGFDPVLVALPNSKLIVKFPCSMGLNPDGSSNEEVGTTPDIYVEQTTADLRKGKDNIIKKVLEIIN